ncbi:hypothetical protein BD410DRAFT_804632 [Rickenella mellea]|uniref:Uncharacterized protein n=1 Tax=Rickenella mellea TaxID=50990 RepID=A0A4Y7Q274_9AGAM|nr:hypothetical protein BD410DRAFT_804632 [Rickenella mellea]
MTTSTSATNSNHSLHSTTQTPRLSSEHTLLSDGFRDGLTAAEFHKAKAMKAKQRRLLKQKKIKSGSKSSGKNKENIPPAARRSKDPMAKLPPLDDLFTLGREEPPSLRDLGRTTYLKACLEGSAIPGPVPLPRPDHPNVHLSQGHPAEDHVDAIGNTTATSTPPGSPSLAHGVNVEDDAANFEPVDRSEEQLEVVPREAAHSVLVGWSSPLTTPPSSPSPGLPKDLDPRLFGGESPLTSPPSSPSRSTRLSDSDSESDSDLGVLLFERLAARRRVAHRQRCVWSSDEGTDDEGDDDDSSSAVSFLHDEELSTTNVPEDVQDAEDVQHESPPVATTVTPTSPEFEEAAIRNGKGKCKAAEDNDNTEPTNATTSQHRTHITAERFDGDNAALVDVQTPAPVTTGPSSSMSLSFDRTRETSLSKRESDTARIPSATRQPHALSESETEVIADTLIVVLMRKQDWMLLHRLLDVATFLGHTWSEEHMITVIRSHPCLVRRETFRGVYYRYDDSMDTDFTRHWGCYFRMQKELSAFRTEI